MNDPEAYAYAFDRRWATLDDYRKIFDRALAEVRGPPKAPNKPTRFGMVRSRLARKFRRPARGPKASSGGLLPGGRRATRKRSKPLPKPMSSMSVHGLGRRCKGVRFRPINGVVEGFGRQRPSCGLRNVVALETNDRDCGKHKDAARAWAILRCKAKNKHRGVL